MANVCSRLHHPHSSYPPTLLQLCYSHCPSISISTHRFLLLSSPSPLHICRSSPLHICRSRRLDSNAESYNTQNFNFNTTNYNDEEADDDIEQWEDALQDYIDSIWILKVFRSYGWMLPVIVISLLLANGPKAFLLALALPLGQSTFTFAFQRMQQDRGKQKPKPKPKPKKGKPQARSSRNATLEREREEEEWVGSKGVRKKKKGYQSRNDVSISNSDRSASMFGGWDELDGEVEPNAQKSSGFEKGKLRRRRSRSEAPLLLRLLISIFPFFEFLE
ncbi:hypothetical protein BUALT_Bualt14G0046900 [Buddleja alternifolia]|uniref:Uncharacterized protein n=1 Tax=Buddleja alternifolia TaxID=168488 RepID=A0AAV6WN48_9LAMI|nr:hypothetical protein BUALT_Bualt14G0046900 [Buddleja alternifolia]